MEGTSPTSYLDNDSNPSVVGKMSPVTLLVTTVAVGGVAVGGSAFALYHENLLLLAAIWGVGFGLAATAAYSYLKAER